MKIKYLIAAFILSAISVIPAKSQELFGNETPDTTFQGSGYHMKPNTGEIEINFLSSYYQQDGNHAAVTGGEGSENLHDFANVLVLNIPIDGKNSIGFFGGIDAYSSASSDKIDINPDGLDLNVSSPSFHDKRKYGTISFNSKNFDREEIYGIRAGYSKEFDYESFQGGISYTKEWNEGNTELNFTGQVFVDQWMRRHAVDIYDLIYPKMWMDSMYTGFVSPNVNYTDLYLKTTRRNSFNGQLFVSQVINSRLQVGISAEVIYMNGLLSTPYQMVYFQKSPGFTGNIQTMDIERLPYSRIKFPFGFRVSYFPLDFMVVRSLYRYYFDDFGIKAHTFEIETPLKLSPSVTLAPFYRYNTQSASTYFKPTFQHTNDEQYYTSDYDLSGLYSNKVGLSIKFAPNFGILRSKPLLGSDGLLGNLFPASKHKDTHGVLMFKYFELRSAYFQRSTDLKAFNVSANLGFGIK